MIGINTIRNGGGHKVLISLFDYTGNWSRPYLEAGWIVIRIDLKIKDADNIHTFKKDLGEIDAQWVMNNILKKYKTIHGVLAAPPCTDFAVSGAKHWAKKDTAMNTLWGKQYRIDFFITLVKKVLMIIDLVKPLLFYAIENPVGRIKRLIPELGEAWYFQPNWYGDPYTKKTGLFGKFNRPSPTNIVVPVKYSYGSKTQRYGGKSERTKELRSITPMGFSNAFYNANN
jgi:hypothetical protein